MDEPITVTDARELRETVLDALGDRDQERVYLGDGNIEFGERVWNIGNRSYSFDTQPDDVDAALMDIVSAVYAYLAVSRRQD
jgi:hypothetical protein